MPDPHSPWRFAVWMLVCLIGSVATAVVLFLPGVLLGFRQASPLLAANLDAFLVPFAGAIVGGCAAGSIVFAGEGTRHAPARTARRMVWFCLAVGLGLGAGVYALAGWGLPLASRQHLFPEGVPADRLFDTQPFLLTNPELWSVQHQFRRVGGFSRAIALTLELRLWTAFCVPVLALAAAAMLFVDRLRSRVVRLLAVQIASGGMLVLGVFLVTGPAVFLRPVRFPQDAAWLLVGSIAVASAWWLRRRLASPPPLPGLGALREPTMDTPVVSATGASDAPHTIP